MSTWHGQDIAPKTKPKSFDYHEWAETHGYEFHWLPLPNTGKPPLHSVVIFEPRESPNLLAMAWDEIDLGTTRHLEAKKNAVECAMLHILYLDRGIPNE